MDQFGGFAAMQEVEVDLLTDAHRVSGTVRTRFGRVTDILNQQSGTHLIVEHATISDHADPAATISAPSAMVVVSSILVLAAPRLTGAASAEMRIQKRGVKSQLVLPPLRVTGTIHLPVGSRPSEGLLSISERFLAMTDATVASGAYPELARSASAFAVNRERAEILLVADDEHPDELLADVLDERTAEAWLRPEAAPGSPA